MNAIPHEDTYVAARFRDTLAKLDLNDLSLEDQFHWLTRTFAAGYSKAIMSGGSIADIQPGECIDTLLKSISFP